MRKRSLSVLCVVCILAVYFSAIFCADVSASDTLLNFGYITSEKTGNIFSDKDDITFTQDVENTTGKKVVAEYSWTITDEEGDQVASYSWTENISSRKTITRSIRIDNPKKFGIYTINVHEENYAASAPDSKYTDNYSEEFSVCISLDENNTDVSFGYNHTMINSTRPRSSDYTEAVPLMQGAGAKWHREDVLWQGVEPKEKGTYIDLKDYVSRASEIQKSGINTVCILTGRNPLYDDGLCPSSGEAIEAYAAFCAHVAKELKGVVYYYEIWNEWNHTSFNPSKEPPETYAKVLKAAYTAIKEVDPNITVIGCDTAGITTSAVIWIGRVLYALNGGTYMDAISVHCYDYSDTEAFPELQFIQEVAYLKRMMDLFKVDVPIWLTEIGFSTYDNSTEGFVAGCSKDVQLDSMVLLRAINKGYGLFDNIIQYDLYDFADRSQVESNWGVLNCFKRGFTDKPEAELLPSGAKPAYLGTAAMNYFVGGNTKYLDMTAAGDRSYAFMFYNRNLKKNVILAINGGFDNTVTKDFELGVPSVDVYDKYGNLMKTMTSDTGDYEVETYSEPIYLVYSSSKIAVTKDGEKITDMSELAAGDRVEVKFTGSEVADEHKPSMFVGQYKNGVMESVEMIEADEVNTSENEFHGDFTVADGVELIKVMCWYKDSLVPVVPAYVID